MQILCFMQAIQWFLSCWSCFEAFSRPDFQVFYSTICTIYIKKNTFPVFAPEKALDRKDYVGFCNIWRNLKISFAEPWTPMVTGMWTSESLWWSTSWCSHTKFKINSVGLLECKIISIAFMMRVWSSLQWYVWSGWLNRTWCSLWPWWWRSYWSWLKWWLQ